MKKLVLMIIIIVLMFFLIPFLFTKKFNLEETTIEPVIVKDESYDYKAYNNVKLLHFETRRNRGIKFG